MKDRNDVINSYVSDMLGLERHISTALEGQVKDLAAYPAVVGEIEGIQAVVRRHIDALEALLRERGGDAESPLKKVGSALLGLGAAAVDLVRSEGLPKNLRDDYTACSLATIGYVMLHTTGLSLDERRVAEVAHDHLRDYARIVMKLHSAIPSAVIEFLQEEGLPAREESLREIAENIESVWRDQSSDVPDAEQAARF